MDKDVFVWAQAIAYKVLVTIVPVLILFTGLVGYVLRRDAPYDTVMGIAREFLPSYRVDALLTFLGQLQDAGAALTTVGSIALIFWAMTLISTLRVVLAGIFREEWHEPRAILHGYLFDLRMVFQLGVLLAASILVTIFIRGLDAAGSDFIASLGLDAIWVSDGWRRLFKTLLVVLPFLLTTVVFFQLFYFIPRPSPPWRSALIGTLVAALLWEASKVAFTAYASNVARVAGSGSPISALGDTFGLIIGLVIWAYLSGLILVVGGIVVLLHETHHRFLKISSAGGGGSKIRLRPSDFEAPARRRRARASQD